MWKNIQVVLMVCTFGVNCADIKKTFLVVGPQTIPYQGKYTVAVSSRGYNKPELLDMQIFGKLEDGTTYQNRKTVTLKSDSLELVKFDLKDQPPGNYFIKAGNQSMRLNLNTRQYSVFIQTDKAIYKPGDKVQFRVLVLSPDTKPFMTKSVEIFITDNDLNRIKQYEHTYFRKGVFREELQLSDQPVLGLWNIHVKINGDEFEKVKSFEVAEYVLPKFEVIVKTSSKISKDEDIVVSFTAKYTYGKEVDGTATVAAEMLDGWWGSKTKKVVKSLDDSTKTVSISLVEDLNLVNVIWTRSILVTVTFTEALTGKQESATAFVQVFPIPYTIEIISSDDNIKPDLPFSLEIFVKDLNEAPVTDDKTPLTTNVTFVYDSYEETDTTSINPFIHWWWRPPIQKVVSFTRFLRDGRAEIPLSITSNVTSINIESYYKDAVRYSWVGVTPSKSNQYLEIKVIGNNHPISKSIEVEVISNVKVKNVKYIVLARNSIVASGKLSNVSPKCFKFKIQPSIEMIPTAKIIVFYVTRNGEIISDRKFLSFDMELNNFLDINLSKTEAKPNNLVNISVKSAPQSYVGLLGVDQSVLLLRSGNDIDRNLVKDELFQYLFADKYNYDWEEPTNYNYYTDFSASDTVVLTNANEEYRREYPRPFYPAPIVDGNTAVPFTTSTANIIPTTTVNPENIPSSGEIVTRKEFPETWLFDCIDNIKGTATVTRKVPDTITSWIVTGFSLDARKGLGLSRDPSKLTVFMPFFISLNLPYSIKRGEIIAIQVIVFNYMDQDYPATVTMSNDKQEFEFVEPKCTKQATRNVTAKSNSGTSVNFLIKATKIGYITLKVEAITTIAGDRVEQLLLVEAEGIKRYVNEAVLIDLRNIDKFSKSVTITVPENVIPDSLRIEASFIGDILGPSVENLDNLLKMPYGCGEQNMLNFVPNIIILDYLTNVNKLTSRIEAKAINYMEVGYQKQLTYKRADGSFSSFGSSDRSGSTWLTAFVARSFNQAAKYITIDANVVVQAIDFLSALQADDGSFPEHGTVNNKPMQGGSSNGIGLTAYVLISFFENQDVKEKCKKVIDKAIENLLTHINDTDDVYIMSIVSYALYLAGKTRDAGSLLKRLDAKAIDTSGTRYWEKKVSNAYMASLSIETSAYALLAYVEAQRDTEALLIAKWLVSQRNAFGGFSSTQDTVIGLLALSKIAAKVTTKTLDITANVKYEGKTKNVIINQSNALVLQQLEIPSSARIVEISANGNGFALAQVSYRFNVPSPLKSINFVLSAKIKSSSSLEFSLDICVELKNMVQSNMAVMEISAPSGYTIGSESQRFVKESAENIKKVELKNGNTLAQVYFDYLESKPQSLIVDFSKVFEVNDQKAASVVVYDYYQNDLRAELFYTPSKVL